MADMYETRHGPEHYAAEQEAALDDLGFTWEWWIDRVMARGIAEIKEEE